MPIPREATNIRERRPEPEGRSATAVREPCGSVRFWDSAVSGPDRVTDRLSGKLIEPSFEIDNLFDSKHDSWGGLFFGTPTWIPAAGRNFQLALRIAL